MHDLLIRGGRLVDGSGNPWRHADVAIDGDRISATGRLRDARARRIVAADGLVVAPGFIDLHAHSDLALLDAPDLLPKVMQGVTTELIGQDGLSYAPTTAEALPLMRELIAGINGNPAIAGDWTTVAEFLARIEAARPAVNVAHLVPHGTVRVSVMGMADRHATERELGAMATLVRQGMVDGAFGLSSGLTYAPARWSDTAELVALCRVVAEYEGIYVTHHRDYGDELEASILEALEIGREAAVPVHFSHFHVSGRARRGDAPRFLGLIDAARAAHRDVTLDSYPYLAGSTFLGAFLPGWAQAGSPAEILARLRDPETRARIAGELGARPAFSIAVEWTDLVVAGVTTERNQVHEGGTVAAAADARHQTAGEFVCELLAEESLGVTVLVFMGDEDNVRSVMQHPTHTVGTDAILVGGSPHPRAYGTYPTYLGRYVRELGVLRLEEAIRHMTSAAAARLGLADRGLLRPGLAADVVVFDPDRIGSPATYADPKRFPLGLPYVIVNGVPVKWADEPTGERPGGVLRHRAGPRGVTAG